MLKKVDSKEEISKLEQIIKLNEEENAYFDSVLERQKQIFGEKCKYSKEYLDFWKEEVEIAKQKYIGERKAVIRMADYMLGKAYEGLANYVMKEEEPVKIASTYLQAVRCYEEADELVGYMTDYSLRRVESLRGAAVNIEKAGDKEKASELFKESYQLLFEFLGAVGIPAGNIVVVNGKIPEELKKAADKKEEGAVTAYEFNGPKSKNQIN